MNKVYSNSKLRLLPEPTQRAIFAIGESMSLESACEQLALSDADGGFAVDVSESTLSKFLRHHRTLNFRENLRRAASDSAEITESLTDGDRDNVDQSVDDGLRVMLFDMMVEKKVGAKDLKRLLDASIQLKRLEIDLRKVELLEKKAAAFDQIEADAEDDNLTPEQRLAKIRKGLQI